jgi:hypothetical protein
MEGCTPVKDLSLSTSAWRFYHWREVLQRSFAVSIQDVTIWVSPLVYLPSLTDSSCLAGTFRG